MIEIPLCGKAEKPAHAKNQQKLKSQHAGGRPLYPAFQSTL